VTEGFVDLFDDETDDVGDGCDFVVCQELLDFEFIHGLIWVNQDLMIKEINNE
jgi:hypothetical protein